MKEKEDIQLITLGKHVRNPHSVDNMKKAYESLKRKGKIKKDISIETTHLYVRIDEIFAEG